MQTVQSTLSQTQIFQQMKTVIIKIKQNHSENSLKAALAALATELDEEVEVLVIDNKTVPRYLVKGSNPSNLNEIISIVKKIEEYSKNKNLISAYTNFIVNLENGKITPNEVNILVSNSAVVQYYLRTHNLNNVDSLYQLILLNYGKNV